MVNGEDDNLPSSYLLSRLFLNDARPDSTVSQCASDEGEDSPPNVTAAARLRVLGHAPPVHTTDIEGDNASMTLTTYRIEVTSVARFTPHAEMDSATRSADTTSVPVDGEVGLRVDTLDLPVEDRGSGSTPRWALCDAGAITTTDTPGVWQFANHKGQWFRVVRWTPSGATWDRVTRLADSVRALVGWSTQWIASIRCTQPSVDLDVVLGDAPFSIELEQRHLVHEGVESPAGHALHDRPEPSADILANFGEALLPASGIGSVGFNGH